jgi:hypothetical protein
MDDIFNEANVPESNWFKFVQVDDKIGGQVSKIFRKEAQGQFPAQICFTLRDAKGTMEGKPFAEEEVNVGVKDNDYFRPRLEKVKLGDKVGFHFTKEIPATVKGNSPAKSITPFVKHLSADERAAYLAANPEAAAADAFDNFS